MTDVDPAQLNQAQRLVQDISRLRGLKPAPLGPDHQVAYGTLLFKFVPESGRLVCAILVSHLGIWDQINDEATAAYRRYIAGLSNPRIGGMFDTAGGSWMFEASSGKTYLYQSFALDTPPKVVNQAIDGMARVVPAWVTRWEGVVADIVHGKQPPPTHRVTLENDPYAGRL